jgi:hypothetical protein
MLKSGNFDNDSTSSIVKGVGSHVVSGSFSNFVVLIYISLKIYILLTTFVGITNSILDIIHRHSLLIVILRL